ncbi:MAG: nucleoside hydrolase [Fibrobacteria bacterium]|nr:nucleoside hydrolase [Fibrobacteria bacterium]
MMYYKILFLFLVSVSLAATDSSTQVLEKFIPGSHYHNGTSLPFRLLLPKNYNPSHSYPLILHLHGASWRGNDNILQIKDDPTIHFFSSDSIQSRHPAFILAPQCPLDQRWVDYDWTLGNYNQDAIPQSNELITVKDMLDSIIQVYSIDTERLYALGQSMGGFGTWDIITRYPNTFAAAIAVCGAGDPAKMHLVQHMAIWGQHGKDDTVIPVSGTRNMMLTLDTLGHDIFYTNCNTENCTGLPKADVEANIVSNHPPRHIYSEYEDGTHDLWSSYLNEFSGQADWLFSFSKQKPFALKNREPLIYCSDLWHPHDDPDDHFDIATTFGMSEFDIKVIILDNTTKSQEDYPGSIPVSQINYLSGRKVPYYIGLRNFLKSPEDKGLDQDEKYQQGPEMILKTLEGEEDSSVSILTLGSLRDVAAAYNRNPDLCKRKIKRLLSLIGDANSNILEWNTNLDPKAYITIMKSEIPFYWVPDWDGGPWKNNGNSSYWNATYGEIMKGAPSGIVQFISYMFQESTEDPIAFLESDVNEPYMAAWYTQKKDFWAGALISYLADRKIHLGNGKYFSIPKGVYSSAPKSPLFKFYPVDVNIHPNSTITYGKTDSSKRVMRFHIETDMETYARGMTEVTNHILVNFTKDTLVSTRGEVKPLDKDNIKTPVHQKNMLNGDIQFSVELKVPYEFKIMDISGRTFLKEFALNRESFTIASTKFTTGMYVIQITTKRKIYTHKFFKLSSL